MKPIYLHDKNEIERFLRKNIYLNIYSIGDLDDFFWPYTTWYALRDKDCIRQIALFYTGTSIPTLLAITGERLDEMREFILSITSLLPGRFHAHLIEGLSDLLQGCYKILSNGLHYKMGLMDQTKCKRVETDDVISMKGSDLEEIEELYSKSYPGHWFEPRMLETGHYYGIRQGSTLVSVGGVHVYSKAYRVAGLGNIATHPDQRGRGLATRVTARLCQALLGTVDHIGLNVKTDNVDAIACYTNLGFEPIATYEECLFE
jgi:GNAT superfamily N-acetyltransferase